jgi:hypothetical protein
MRTAKVQIMMHLDEVRGLGLQKCNPKIGLASLFERNLPRAIRLDWDNWVDKVL